MPTEETLKVKPEIDGYREMAKLAETELPKLRDMQKKLQAESVMKMTDNYFHFAKLYVDRIIGRFETVIKASKDNVSKLKNYQNRLWLYDNRALIEAKYGYEREKILLLEDKESYQLTAENVKKLRKGMSYEQIMHLFKMRGYIFPGIKEMRNGKMVTHWPATWQQGERFVYVDLVNGRVEYWRVQHIEDFWK